MVRGSQEDHGNLTGMALRVEFHPEAFEEARAAYQWYSERSRAAACAFMKELTAAVGAVAESPKRWPASSHGTRRYLLKRFPFLVVYRCFSDHLEVLALAHGRRRPGYWRSRS